VREREREGGGGSAPVHLQRHARTLVASARCVLPASDCWDAEILMSSGWVECVGIADRSAFDLQVRAVDRVFVFGLQVCAVDRVFVFDLQVCAGV
jgi:hypothetical protein